MRVTVGIATIAVLLSALFTSPARGAFTVCNHASIDIWTAVGYQEGGIWTSEGWWELAPGQCATPIPGDVSSRAIYVRGESNSRWAMTWGSNFDFCAKPTVFKIAGDQNCEQRGFTKELFFEAKKGGGPADYTQNLSCPSCPSSSASDATEWQVEQQFSVELDYGSSPREETRTLTLPAGYIYQSHQVVELSRNDGNGEANYRVTPTTNGVTVWYRVSPGGLFWDQQSAWLHFLVKIVGKRGTPPVVQAPLPQPAGIPSWSVDCICKIGDTYHGNLLRSDLWGAQLPTVGSIVNVGTNQVCIGCSDGVSIQGNIKIRVTRVYSNSGNVYKHQIIGVQVP